MQPVRLKFLVIFAMFCFTLENFYENFLLICQHFQLFFVFIYLGTFIFGCIMSLAALAQEKFWENKAQCEDAEKAYYSRLSGAKVSFFCFFICFQTWVNFGLFAFFTYYPLFWSKIVSYFCYDILHRVTFLSFFHHVYFLLKLFCSCRTIKFLWKFENVLKFLLKF